MTFTVLVTIHFSSTLGPSKITFSRFIQNALGEKF